MSSSRNLSTASSISEEASRPSKLSSKTSTSQIPSISGGEGLTSVNDDQKTANDSSKRLGSGLSKSQAGSKSTKGKKISTTNAVLVIERAWISYRDRQIFRLLKHAVCAAESSLSTEIMKKVAPREAELLKDKSVKCRIRFRFGGTEFPPLIYFKVYINSDKTSKGTTVTYVHGRKMIQGSSQAARDACDLMGNRRYFETLLQDTMQHEHYGITDEMDVSTLKDYMQYLSRLDELPAYMGGRDNSWRKLTLEALPRHIIFYDVVEFAYNHQMSDGLRAEIPSLMLRPTTQDVQLEHMRIISSYRTPMTIAYPTPKSKMSTSQGSSRRSWQAKQRVLKMKRMYDANREIEDPSGLGREKTFETMTSQVRIDPVVEVMGEDLQDAEQLYEWTQKLTLDELGLGTPRLNTRSVTQTSLKT